MEGKSFYALIPAVVRYDEKLPSSAKLLFGEIYALARNEGYCWATNDYFANLYGVAVNTITRWITMLEKSNYIKRSFKYSKQNKRTRILVIDENVCPSVQNCMEGVNKNDGNPTHKNGGYNNINIIYKIDFKKLIYNYTTNSMLRKALLDYCDMRKESYPRLSEADIQRNLDELKKISDSDEEKIKIVQTSSFKHWAGFFPLPKEKPSYLCNFKQDNLDFDSIYKKLWKG